MLHLNGIEKVTQCQFTQLLKSSLSMRERERERERGGCCVASLKKILPEHFSLVLLKQGAHLSAKGSWSLGAKRKCAPDWSEAHILKKIILKI